MLGTPRPAGTNRALSGVWVWAVFLLIPIVLILTVSDATPTWRAVAVLATIAFGVAFVRFMTPLDEVPLPAGPKAPSGAWRTALLGLVQLVAMVALTVPALGSPALFVAYFASVGLSTLPLWQGLVWTAVVTAATVLPSISFLGPEWLLHLIGPLVSVAMVVVLRVKSGNEQAASLMRAELHAVQEREAISRDVHDILGHSLTVVSLKAQLARKLVRVDPGRAEAELDEVLALTQSALDDVRATVGLLRVPDLASQLASSREALESAGVHVTITGNWDDLTPDRRALAAWLVREATTNVLRHARATACDIHIGADAMRVTDDGVGAKAAEGHGITGLRRRVRDSGGALTVTAVDEAAARPGTKVEVTFA